MLLVCPDLVPRSCQAALGSYCWPAGVLVWCGKLTRLHNGLMHDSPSTLLQLRYFPLWCLALVKCSALRGGAKVSGEQGGTGSRATSGAGVLLAVEVQMQTIRHATGGVSLRICINRSLVMLQDRNAGTYAKACAQKLADFTISKLQGTAYTGLHARMFAPLQDVNADEFKQYPARSLHCRM